MGYEALANGNSEQNTAIGFQALYGNSGSNNTALGTEAGAFVSGGEYNIDIGAQTLGNSGDNGVIRIGSQGGQTAFFAAGISGVNISGAPVMVNSNGQLGIVTSSARFKKDIEDMGDASSRLLNLRPVTFRYKEPYDDGSNPLDYGLIAEEVADVYPDLVVKDKDGQIETIQYQKLTPMLLNEVRKQAEKIHSLEDRLAALETSLKEALFAAAPERRQ